MRKDFFDKETLTAATARTCCNSWSCAECRQYFDFRDKGCPGDLATKEQCVTFMQDLYIAVQDKFKDTPDWMSISFEDIENIIATAK